MNATFIFLWLLWLVVGRSSPPGSACDFERHPNEQVDFQRSRQDGADIVTIKAINLTSIDECSQSCCDDEKKKCNLIIFSSSGKEEKQCLLLSCWPLDKCITKNSSEEVNVIKLTGLAVQTTSATKITSTKTTSLERDGVENERNESSQFNETVTTVTFETFSATESGKDGRESTTTRFTETTDPSNKTCNESDSVNWTEQPESQTDVTTHKEGSKPRKGVWLETTTNSKISRDSSSNDFQNETSTITNEFQLGKGKEEMKPEEKATILTTVEEMSTINATTLQSSTSSTTSSSQSNESKTNENEEKQEKEFSSTIPEESTTSKKAAPIDTKGSSIDSEQQQQQQSVMATKNIHLIIALVIGLILLMTVFGLIFRRFYDGWQRRHYQRMDFLVDGMYNVSST